MITTDQMMTNWPILVITTKYYKIVHILHDFYHNMLLLTKLTTTRHYNLTLDSIHYCGWIGHCNINLTAFSTGIERQPANGIKRQPASTGNRHRTAPADGIDRQTASNGIDRHFGFAVERHRQTATGRLVSVMIRWYKLLIKIRFIIYF